MQFISEFALLSGLLTGNSEQRNCSYGNIDFLIHFNLIVVDIICSPSRCPYRDDRYLSSLVPVGPSSGLDFPSHYRRFIFKMFTFVDPNSMEPLREQVINTSTDEKRLQQNIFILLCQHCFPCSGVHSLQYRCLLGCSGPQL